MHRYEELEKLYYKKRRNFFLSIFIVFVLIVSVIFFALYKQPETKNKSIKKQNLKKQEVVKKEVNQSKTIEKKVEVKEQVIKEKKEINQTKTPKQKEELKLEFVLPNIAQIKTPKEKTYKPKQTPKPKPKKVVKPKNANLEVVEINKINLEVQKVDLNKLISSFNRSPNYDLALSISKEYLNRGDVKNAQKWALKANAIDPERVDSWIQFADILLKQGKKEKALQILRVYIDSYGENEEINRKLRSINE